jgi:hypothetical protein
MAYVILSPNEDDIPPTLYAASESFLHGATPFIDFKRLAAGSYNAKVVIYPADEEFDEQTVLPTNWPYATFAFDILPGFATTLEYETDGLIAYFEAST